MKLADELRQITNDTNQLSVESDVNAVTQRILAKARSSAKDGSSSIRLYFDELKNSKIAAKLRENMKANGFTVVIDEDLAYTQHAGQIQMYIEISW